MAILTAEIAFVLNAALDLGIRIGAAPDGSELIMVAPMRVPYAVRRQFEIVLENHQAEIIDFIQRENAARAGASS